VRDWEEQTGKDFVFAWKASRFITHWNRLSENSLNSLELLEGRLSLAQATNRDLAQGLKNHLEETNKQIERLDQVFKKLGKTPQSTDCPAIDGLIKEADNTAGEVEDKSVLDAAIIANAQAVEHYEIARYGTLSPARRSLVTTTSSVSTPPISTRRRRPTPNSTPSRSQGRQP
jgi:uncharacterized protein YecE (DUF72 family)